MKRKYTCGAMKRVLRKHLVDVTFIRKSDGAKRNMRCTLRQDVLLDNLIPRSKKKTPLKKRAKGIVTVFDVELGQWRCFVAANVTKFRTVKEA